MDQRRQAGDSLDAVVVPSVPGERGAPATERPGLQPGQPLAQTGPAAADQALVAHESPAAAGEDRGAAGEACAVLLAPAGGRASDPAAFRRDAAEDLGATGAGRLTRGLSATKPAWRRNGTRVERCLRNALKAGAPVGRTSARAEVTASGAGRMCDDKSFVRSAALRVYKGPSGAGKTEIPVHIAKHMSDAIDQVRRAEVRSLRQRGRQPLLGRGLPGRVVRPSHALAHRASSR